MHWTFWLFMGLALKLPVIGLCVFVWKVANDAPEQVLGEGDGGGGTEYAPGPRNRGPHGGLSTRNPLPRTREHPAEPHKTLVDPAVDRRSRSSAE
jgi:hypothetical protein